GGPPARGRARRRLAPPRRAADGPRRGDHLRAPRPRRRADRDRRQQPVAVRREAVVRPRAERAERFGRGPRRYPARPEGARGEPRGRALPDAFGRRAARSDRRLRARGGAAPLMLLAGRVGIVSGIGPGLGRAVALALAREGADVVLAARTAPALADVAAEVRVAGRHALGVPTDVT